MSKKSRGDALDDISAWDTEGVLCLLRKVSLPSRSAPYFASLKTRGNRGNASGRDFTADTDCQRRDRDNVSEHRGARQRERGGARCTCASKVVNASIYSTTRAGRRGSQEARVDFEAIFRQSG